MQGMPYSFYKIRVVNHCSGKQFFNSQAQFFRHRFRNGDQSGLVFRYAEIFETRQVNYFYIESTIFAPLCFV